MAIQLLQCSVEERGQLASDHRIERLDPGGNSIECADAGVALCFEALLGTPAVAPGQQSFQETILLVEDEVFVRNAATAALESAGYQVVAAGSASQALEMRGRYCGVVDLLLSDVVLPGINGYELAAEFLALHPDIRILLMSGYSEQLAACEIATCPREYLAKPFSIPTLLRRIREVLDTSTARAAD